MTSRTAFLLVATIAHLVSAQSEIDQDTVDNAPRCRENCQAPSDAATLIQSPVGIAAAAFAATDMKGQEEEDAEDDPDDQIEELEDVEDRGEGEKEQEEESQEQGTVDDDGCKWVFSRRRDSGKEKQTYKTCGPACHADPTCFGYMNGRRRWMPPLIQTGAGNFETKSQGSRRRRRRCDFKKGSSCPARCIIPEDKKCTDKYDKKYTKNVLSGDQCTLGCLESGYSLSFDAPNVKLRCANGTLSGPADYKCLPNTVNGTLSVKEISATNLKNSETWGGHSDPYVVFKHNGKTQQTDVKLDTANATWTSTIEFKNPNRAEMLHVYVWDDDTFSDDNLGSGDISLKEVIEKKEGRTYTLNLEDRGQLSIKVSFQVAER